MKTTYLVRRITESTPALAAQIAALLPQLSATWQGVFTEADLQALLAQPRFRLYVALTEERVVGMVSFAGYLIPTGEKWQMEDVVVLESHRGTGVARKMLREALQDLRASTKATIYLTSRPERVAANALYASLGFEPRRTNVYRVRAEWKGSAV